MPTTTKQLAKITGVSESTIRNWTDVYSELLTPSARGDAGARLFSDQDVQILCSIADLRRENVPPAEVTERLRRGDVYIELASPITPQQTTTDHNNDTASRSDDLLLPVALSSHQSQIDALRDDVRALQRNQGTRTTAIATGIVIGVALSIVIIAWALWLAGFVPR